MYLSIDLIITDNKDNFASIIFIRFKAVLEGLNYCRVWLYWLEVWRGYMGIVLIVVGFRC